MNIDGITDAEIGRIASEIDRAGYAMIPNVFSAAELSEARAFVAHELKRHNGQYFCLDGPDAVQGTFMERLGRMAPFREFLATVQRDQGRRDEPMPGIYQTLRVLSGSRGVKESLKFHFDAYAVTALAPISIPTEPGVARGDLVLYPNLRNVRSSAILNVIEKAIFQNRLARKIMSTAIVRRMLGAKIVAMEPGNLYLFWGYRSLHANEACDPGSLRCTALFHFLDPHEHSAMVRLIKNRRRTIEAASRDRVVTGMSP